MAQTVVGIFENASEAQNAVEQLISSGFTRNNIDVSVQNTSQYSDSSKDVDDDDGSAGDGIGNFFSNLFGGSDDNAKKYAKVARRGSVVTVHAQSSEEAERAADILDEYGAVDVDEHASESRSEAKASTTDTTLRDTTDITDANNASVKVIEEELKVGKRMVQTGGARLRSRIVERPVEESLRLREERVRIERNAVNRPASEADLTNFKEGQIELIESAEVPVVSKEARVVEEISLSKEVEEREETIKDTVRHTEVDVEDLKKDENIRRPDVDVNREDTRKIDEDARRRATDL